jgi:acetyl-CoA carboxylase carboxyl transferase subunit beta
MVFTLELVVTPILKLFDNNEFVELDKKLDFKDPLRFVDTKKYADRLKESWKTKLKDAVRTRS